MCVVSHIIITVKLFLNKIHVGNAQCVDQSTHRQSEISAKLLPPHEE